MSAAVDQNAALRSFEATWRARPADALTALHTEAMERFLALGLPTSRDESWRYTTLRSIAARGFVDAAPAPAARASWLAAAGAEPLEIVNGYARLDERAAPRDPAYEALSLRSIAERDPAFLATRIAPLTDAEDERWTLLNRALFVDGIHLRISGRVAAPILIVHSAESARDDAAIHSRVIVEAEAGGEATIIEHQLGGAGHNTLVNHATQIELAAGASIEHYRIFSGDERSTHFDALSVAQSADSRCRQFTVALGGALVRANLRTQLDGSGAGHDSYALLVGQGARQVDCVNTVVHAASRTTSRQTARALGAGSSRVVFNSKVIVAEGTTGADSRQSCRGLLLSPAAEIDTRPQLEIFSDEVKCSHGATIGRLDENMLFYLLSRGIERPAARTLLIYAFLDDVLTGMSVQAARRSIEEALIGELPDPELLRTFR
ncbi:MAG TPA: Fe-S cluster assembly protein SufD [Steroidobacteraceae bacterium]|nr:Fe-S cluster assembly protein SufD [Steroidobacteraceae bacterium]